MARAGSWTCRVSSTGWPRMPRTCRKAPPGRKRRQGRCRTWATKHQRVRQLRVQGANGTNNQGDLNPIAAEVEQLTQAVKQDANTQYAGQYVFSGTTTTTAPYAQGENDTYHGNEGTIARAIGPGPLGHDQYQHLDAPRQRRRVRRRQAARHAAHDRPGPSQRSHRGTDEHGPDQTRREHGTLSELQATAGSVTDQSDRHDTHRRPAGLDHGEPRIRRRHQRRGRAEIAYSNEQAAYTAALKSGASIIQESLLNFLK